MSGEAGLGKEVEKGILGIDPNAHISFVESGLTAAGIPDMDVCILGKEIHIELKYGYEKHPPHLRSSQYKWFKNRIKAGGHPLLFAKIWDPVGYVYCLYEAKSVLKLKGRLSNMEWIALADYKWDRGMDWEEFKD